MRVVGGTARGLKLKTPQRLRTRPTLQRVRGAIFNRLALMGLEGANVLDLYAGTGSLGLEALSRGAQRADFVEAEARLCAVIRANLSAAGREDAGRVFHSRVERALQALDLTYDIVFLDPPYASGFPHRVMARLAGGSLLHPGATVVVEHFRHVSPGAEFGDLALDQDRRYGDSAVAFYVFGGRE